PAPPYLWRHSSFRCFAMASANDCRFFSPRPLLAEDHATVSTFWSCTRRPASSIPMQFANRHRGIFDPVRITNTTRLMEHDDIVVFHIAQRALLGPSFPRWTEVNDCYKCRAGRKTIALRDEREHGPAKGSAVPMDAMCFVKLAR